MISMYSCYHLISISMAMESVRGLRFWAPAPHVSKILCRELHEPFPADVVLLSVIKVYYIIVYYIILCSILFYSILFYHIISYHIISYHIISYHIISYYIILH